MSERVREKEREKECVSERECGCVRESERESVSCKNKRIMEERKKGGETKYTTLLISLLLSLLSQLHADFINMHHI